MRYVSDILWLYRLACSIVVVPLLVSRRGFRYSTLESFIRNFESGWKNSKLIVG